MAVTGKLASFKWVATIYDTDDCLQSWELSKSVEDITYFCNGRTKHLVGNADAVFSCTLALSATDTAKIAAFEEGATGAWEGHPAGDTLNYIEFLAAKGTVLSAPISAPQNGVVTLDLTIALDDLTEPAATA
jgi:hypothetical protein